MQASYLKLFPLLAKLIWGEQYSTNNKSLMMGITIQLLSTLFDLLYDFEGEMHCEI